MWPCFEAATADGHARYARLARYNPAPPPLWGEVPESGWRERGRVAGVTTLDSGNSRPTCPHLTERVNKGGVNTFEHLYGCGVNPLTFEHRLNVNAPALWRVRVSLGFHRISRSRLTQGTVSLPPMSLSHSASHADQPTRS